MKIRTYLLLAVILAFFAGLGYWQRITDDDLRRRGRPSSVQAASFLLEFMRPIKFYGKAVDQHGNPVAGAKVYFSANDVPWGDGSKYRVRTDTDGRFELTSARGASLYVRVSKEGYDFWYTESGEKESKQDFGYGADKARNHNPDKANPVVFTLRKLEQLEPLEARSEFTFEIPKDGEWRRVSLHADKNPAHAVNFRCVSKLDTVPFGQPYEWEVEVSVAKGGLVERTDKNLFVAPQEGYRPSDKVVMPKTQPRWTELLERDYFIRFEDGVFARIELDVAVRDRQLGVCESWMNLKAGSRQLEVAPVIPLR